MFSSIKLHHFLCLLVLRPLQVHEEASLSVDAAHPAGRLHDHSGFLHPARQVRSLLFKHRTSETNLGSVRQLKKLTKNSSFPCVSLGKNPFVLFLV